MEGYRMAKGIEQFPCQALGFISLEKRWLQGDLMAAFQ